METRSISFSEISSANSCAAQWDFRYGGHLAGDALERKELAPVLSDGRAWGAAVAAWHASHGSLGPVGASLRAFAALNDSYAADRAEMAENGSYVLVGDAVERRSRIETILQHYMTTTQPFENLTKLEGEIEVPLRSRSGKGFSNRYLFRCFLDGYTIGEHGHQWITEFKLRSSMQDAEQVMLGRQPRWYAWALRELQRQQGMDTDIVGVIVDERWNQVPKPPRILMSGKPSTAKDQLTTPEAYLELCQELEVEPNFETVLALRERRWSQRIPIAFRDGELDEAGQELISAAKLIHQLDTGQLYPIRNARPAQCRFCDFRRICSEPGDRMLVDSLFIRKVPKRLREPEEVANA